MAEAKKAEKAETKMTFQEALTATRKELSEKVSKVKVGKETREVKGVFNYTDKVEIEFTSDFKGYEKGQKETFGILTGLSFVKMGIAKKA